MSGGHLAKPEVVQALLDAFASIASETDEHAILEEAVDVARMVTSSRYGAAVLVGPRGITHLAHAGMPARQVAALPHPPLGEGLLGAVLSERRTFRLDDLADHPASGGFPVGHVPMTAFLGVPMWAESELVGALYLTRPPGHGTYSEADEVLVSALARQVGAAVRSVRVAREAAGLASRLAAAKRLGSTRLARLRHDARPVETIQQILTAGCEALGVQTLLVSRLDGDHLAFEHASEGLDRFGVTVGHRLPQEASLCHAVRTGRSTGVIPDTLADPVASGLALVTGTGLRSYIGVSLALPDGTDFGSLCGLSQEAVPFGPDDQPFLAVLAEMVGLQLERQRAMDADMAERRGRVAALFAPGALRVYLQPIVDLLDGTVVGVEALSRFPGTGGGPHEAFREAAAVGLGVELELLAVQRALELLDGLPTPLFLSVNAGPATVLDPRLAPLLTVAGAGRVVLEITEHEDLAAHAGVADALNALQQAGVATAVDDTGAGFASLQAVLDLAPDKLKLDATLVRGVDHDPARRALARALVGLASELGASLIAEGIETQTELDALRDLGMRFGQGFHLGRPAPADQLDLSRRHLLHERLPERRSATSPGAALRAPEHRGTLPSPRDGEDRLSG